MLTIFLPIIIQVSFFLPIVHQVLSNEVVVFIFIVCIGVNFLALLILLVLLDQFLIVTANMIMAALT